MKRFFALLLAAAIVFCDQYIKLWAIGSLAPVGKITVIPGFFSLTYVENRGAAFGILQDKTIFLSLISGILLFSIVIAIILGRFNQNIMLWTVSIGAAGGIGNLYDRVFRGFVVDYLDFSSLFGFPVFNLADCCVVIATFLILIYFIILDNRQKSANRDEGVAS